MPLVNSPEELRRLPESELSEVAAELRREILDSVSRNGGHLASSLGAVELIVALHRVFDTPREKIFFDVGHQAYAHKLLTGRREGFARLRHTDGIGGFPHPAESPTNFTEAIGLSSVTSSAGLPPAGSRSSSTMPLSRSIR